MANTDNEKSLSQLAQERALLQLELRLDEERFDIERERKAILAEIAVLKRRLGR